MIAFYIPKFRQGGLEAIFSRYFHSLLTNNSVLLITDQLSLEYIDEKLLNNEHFHVETISSERIKKIKDISVILNSYKFKNIHCIQYDAARLMILLASRTSTSIIYHERSYLNNLKISILKIMNFILCKPIKLITANSLDQAKLLTEKFNTCQVMRLHNPIFPDMLNYDKKYRLQRKKHFKFFSVGRFDNQKNIEFVINNIDLVRYVFGTDFIIDIFLNDKSFVQAKKMPPNRLIRFRKFDVNLPRKLDDYDLGIIPTKYEGFSNIIFETGISGVPLVINRHDHGLSEMQDLFAIEIFDSDDPKTFINALKLVKADMEKEKCYQLDANALNKYSFASSLEEFRGVAEKYKA